LACHLQIDANQVPDLVYHFDADPDADSEPDADPDPDFNLMRIQIWIFI
jgi:hypothetical protein